MKNVAALFLDSRGVGEHPFEDLSSLRVFVRTVELGNFSEVARKMGVTPAMVSKRIASLEIRLGQRLLNRNTRKLSVTEAGQRLYDHCIPALSELDQAAAEMSDLYSSPHGLLRVTAPPLLGVRCIGPYVPEFLQKYPNLALELNFSSHRLDLVQQRIDVAVRIADVIEPGLVAIKLAAYRRVFCAAPSYLSRHGCPQVPQDLMHHSCLVSNGATPNNQWTFRDGSGLTQARVKGQFACDSADVVRAATLAGLGISMAPRWLVANDLESGALVEILSEYTPSNRAVYAVLLHRTETSRKLAAMVEFLKECFAELP